MTPKELLKPRRKVITDYPGNRNKVGDIIVIEHAGTPEAAKLVCAWYDKYPHIFQPLLWWQDRKPEDFTEYVSQTGKVFKLRVDLNDDTAYVNDCPISLHTLRFYTPATKEKYDAYQQTRVS